jgi:hypothetical protein
MELSQGQATLCAGARMPQQSDLHYYYSGHTANIDPLSHRRPDGALRRVARSSRPLNRCVD